MLSLLVYHHRCLCLGHGASFSKLSASASCCCHFFIIGGSGVTSCGCVCWLLRLIIGGVFLLFSTAASPQPKLTYPFVSKFQQVIGTNRELFEKVLSILFSQIGAWIKQLVYICMGQRFGWEIYFPPLSELNRFWPSPF